MVSCALHQRPYTTYLPRFWAPAPDNTPFFPRGWVHCTGANGHWRMGSGSARRIEHSMDRADSEC